MVGIGYTTAGLKAIPAASKVSGYTKLAKRNDGAFSTPGSPGFYTWFDDENATGDLGDLILKPDDNTGFYVLEGDRTYYGSGAPPTLPLTTSTMNALGSFRWIDVTTGTVYDYAGAAGWLISTVGGNGLITSSGLVAEYRFNEMTGTTLTDYSGNSRNGSIVGTAGTNYAWIDWAPRGLQFNGGGSGGYVDISQSGFNWFGTSGVTCEVVYAGISNQSFCRWFECAAGFDNSTFAFVQSSGTTGQPLVGPGFSLSPPAGYNANLTSILAVTNYRWQYWACTFGGGNTRIFNNLNQTASVTYTGSIVDTTRATAYIGLSTAEGVYGDGRLNGVMALLRVYNRVLTNAERRLNFLATKEIMRLDGIEIT